MTTLRARVLNGTPAKTFETQLLDCEVHYVVLKSSPDYRSELQSLSESLVISRSKILPRELFKTIDLAAKLELIHSQIISL